MNSSGFIVLYRKLLDWEWFREPNTLSLFIYILLKASFADTKFFGKKIKRGQLITSLSSMASETGLSIQNVRTALKHLISTGEITENVTGNAGHEYRIITVVKYNDYQDLTGSLTGKTTVSQQAANRQLTGSQHRCNNINNINNGTINKSRGFTPPTLDEITAYIQEIHGKVDPGKFFDHYSSCGWVLKGGQKMKDWKATVRNWERRETGGRNERSASEAHGENRTDYSFLRENIIQV